MKEVHDLLRDLEEGEAYEAKVIKVLDIGVVVSIGYVACTEFERNFAAVYPPFPSFTRLHAFETYFQVARGIGAHFRGRAWAYISS